MARSETPWLRADKTGSLGSTEVRPREAIKCMKTVRHRGPGKSFSRGESIDLHEMGCKKIETLFGAGQCEVKRGLSRLVATRHAAPGASATASRLGGSTPGLSCCLRPGARRDQPRQAGRRSRDTGGRVSASFWLFSGGSSLARPAWVLPMRPIRPKRWLV